MSIRHADQEAFGVLHFIYNPIAGKGKSRRCREELEKLLRSRGAPYRFHETHARGEALEIVRQLTGSGDETDIVAMGGDGTLNEVLNGIVDPARARLGIIPCGSGNDFAAVARIPQAPEAALGLILDGQARYTDFMTCSGVRGINAIGAGIDVDILRRYNRMKLLKGSAAYLASLIITVLAFKFYRFSEYIDGKAVPHSALIACAGNGQCFGGGIYICPEARIDDGLLDIVIVDNLKKRDIPGAFVQLMKKRVLDLKYTRFRRDAALKITSDAPMPIQIDGEIHEDLPFDVRVVHNALRVYRP